MEYFTVGHEREQKLQNQETEKERITWAQSNILRQEKEKLV